MEILFSIERLVAITAAVTVPRRANAAAGRRLAAAPPQPRAPRDRTNRKPDYLLSKRLHYHTNYQWYATWSLNKNNVPTYAYCNY